MKKTLVRSLAMAFVGSLLMAGSALAIPTLKLWDGVNAALLIADGSSLDASTAAGVVLYSGGYGGWAVSIETGTTKPLVGSSGVPYMDLAGNSNVNSGAGATLNIAFSEDYFGAMNEGLAGFKFHYGGTTAGTAQFKAFADETNTLFGEGILLGDSGVLGAGAYSGTIFHNATPEENPFSLTIAAIINHPVALTNTTWNAELVPTPEPATMLLLGTGLVGLAGVRRRAKKA